MPPFISSLSYCSNYVSSEENGTNTDYDESIVTIIYFSEGIYIIVQTITITKDNIIFQGEGSDRTTIEFQVQIKLRTFYRFITFSLCNLFRNALKRVKKMHSIVNGHTDKIESPGPVVAQAGQLSGSTGRKDEYKCGEGCFSLQQWQAGAGSRF